MTSEQGSSPPAGWYADPSGAPAWRYWDGSQWTEHVSPWPAQQQRTPADLLAEERRWARYARWALVAYVPFQTGGIVFGALATEHNYHGTLFEETSRRPGLFEPVKYGLPQLACTLMVLAATLVLSYWCMQAARTAKAQGIPIVRSPGWAMAGWFIPILNFWWPPQTIRSFARDRAQLAHVVGWWICWIVATAAGVVGVVVAGTSDFGAAIPFLAVAAASIASFAVLGIPVVNTVLAIHERGVTESV